jgi:UDP-N-acetylglucosamine 2-epimerase (non-hydrolysing)
MSPGRGTPATEWKLLQGALGAKTARRPTILHVVAETYDLVVLAPVMRAVAARDVARQLLVHSGLPDELPSDLVTDLPSGTDTVHLGVRRGSDAEETARVLLPFEQLLLDEQPAAVVVAGDATSALACGLTATKLGVPLGRLDSGLRCEDWGRPEEINRALLDRLSDTLFAHDRAAQRILLDEGFPAERIHVSGNTLADSVRRCELRARELRTWERYGVGEGRYVLVTLRAAGYASASGRLATVARALAELSQCVAVVVTADALTSARLDWLAGGTSRVQTVDVATYVERLALALGAGAIVTDSGPVQDEASLLGVASHTLAPDTERRVTLTRGTNVLLGDDLTALVAVRPSPHVPPLDAEAAGTAGRHVANVLVAHYILRQAGEIPS